MQKSHKLECGNLELEFPEGTEWLPTNYHPSMRRLTFMYGPFDSNNSSTEATFERWPSLTLAHVMLLSIFEHLNLSNSKF